MAEDIQEKVTTLAANYSSIAQSIASLTGTVLEGNRQNTEIIKQLAVLNSKQEGNSKYQDDCDKERRLIVEKVNINSRSITGIISEQDNIKANMKAGTVRIYFAITTGLAALTAWVEFIHK